MAPRRPRTNAILEDARPSDGVFASLPKCLESPPAPSREDRKKTTSAVFHLLPCSFSPRLCPPPSLPRNLANASETSALDMNAPAPDVELAKNATRCGFSARQHPNYQGYVQGGDAQTSDRVARHPATGLLTTAWRADPLFSRCPRASTAPWLIPPPELSAHAANQDASSRPRQAGQPAGAERRWTRGWPATLCAPWHRP